VAILQRGRTHGGQVIVVTQSVADPEALSGQAGLLPSLTDNFSAVVAHRQTAPESRDWLAKLMGTRAIWQTTNQTTQSTLRVVFTTHRSRPRSLRQRRVAAARRMTPTSSDWATPIVDPIRPIRELPSETHADD